MDAQTQFASLLSTGLLLVGVGAILTYAVKVDVDWINLSIVGTIGLVLGIGCLVVALLAAVNAGERSGRR